MFLTRLVYASTITDAFQHTDIESILFKAREQNAKIDVTGMLCFNRKYFLQCLEGSRTNVNKTYHKILNDRRHTRIILLDYKEISVREFGSWSMGYMPESSMTKPINLKYSGKSDFEPYEMSGDSAWKMMIRLKENIPSV
ncbi:BLUF domain-containing protein [Alteromonadaceae bacterium M269]|nr:BLUF domain-containing protein [Alteromonadaceae bacterium M269]